MPVLTKEVMKMGEILQLFHKCPIHAARGRPHVKCPRKFNITVFSDKRVEIKWNFGDELVQFVEEQQQAEIFLIVKENHSCYNGYRKE